MGFIINCRIFNQPEDHQVHSCLALNRIFRIHVVSRLEVQVARKASVAKLREAVESVFCGMSMNREDVKISWPHVWSHFCLCYKHYKLIDEKSRIKRFGIRDGDLLHFVNRVA
ncbi:hypothetical protein SDJN03_16452, partial [Cucurbita argyrosperma subsp. sororia]